MPSLPSRLYSAYSRTVIRSRDWGEGDALARRARRLFLVPPIVQRLALRGVRCEVVHDAASGVRGEWIVPPDALPPATHGVVLYVHGGGYVACSAAERRPLTAVLARLTRRRVFASDYRLAPEHPFPAALDDTIAVYRWLQQQGAPGARIAIAGESAGGGLVLALAQHARDAGMDAPACVVALSPWSDLAGTGGSATSNDGRCAMFHPENTRAFAAAYLDGHPANDPKASPLYGSFDRNPPMLIHVGSTELLLDDARRVHERALAAGSESTLRIFDDTAHAWHLLVGYVPEATVAVREMAAFMSRVLDDASRGRG